ncbi:porin family protein [Bosea sp. 685]|uniref:outer membrane protein n=1 Tax=Bosea sp. 685 TaxID=3080057 RepID=UPI00289329FB|nr:porin family protein [Bosea sp. 685]WNJ93549.1 porin family protein [Bosea sp. 685]
MNKLIFAALAAAALSGPAVAADLVSHNTKAPAAVPIMIYNWTGFYIGAHAGAAFPTGGSITETAPVAPDTFYNITGATSALGNKTDFTGGAQAGYNFQINQFVLGAEGDFGYLGYRSTAVQRNPLTGAPQAPPIGDTFGRKKADWLATIRARVGVAFDRLLVYATAGVAFSDLQYSVSDTCNVTPCGGGLISGNASPDIGWVFGGGAEYAFTDNWTIKGEYLYNRFEGKNIRGDATYRVGSGSTPYHAAATEIHVVRLGLNYKF